MLEKLLILFRKISVLGISYVASYHMIRDGNFAAYEKRVPYKYTVQSYKKRGNYTFLGTNNFFRVRVKTAGFEKNKMIISPSKHKPLSIYFTLSEIKCVGCV